jgi:hypothetical protein
MPPHTPNRRGRYEWWNRPPLRDLFTEQDLALYELDEKSDLFDGFSSASGGRQRQKRRRTSGN